ncbi:hypothetical protein [Microbulbifer sp. 2205BS26-8]|uniref:hypothetical protein n=1 Tax=Microbulbifer sp. 2205BS26-8 TaxID=3064386 RepID=UPI00273E684F|nr:hypothetical protein [Microbulbifer sp. 2205BS26-8]MDP5211279.1 hypothetical protein [Microbulbifer sp. 2205BS26-8]
MTIDAGQKIRLDAYSDTHGLEGFYVKAKPLPLDENGGYADRIEPIIEVIPPIGSFDGYYRLADDGIIKKSFIAGFHNGMSMTISEPYDNPHGFRWRISIPPQEQLHQNSAGYRLDVYGQ